MYYTDQCNPYTRCIHTRQYKYVSDVCGRCLGSAHVFFCSAHRHQPKGTAVLWRWYYMRSVQHSWAFLEHLSMCIRTCAVDNTQLNSLNTVEDSKLQSQGCTRCVDTSACFKQSDLLNISVTEAPSHHVQPLLY